MKTLFKIIATLSILVISTGHAQDYQNLKFIVIADQISSNNSGYSEHIQEQSQVLLEMWNEGIVENVYLYPPENSDVQINIVFFIRAQSEEEAHQHMKRMPFVANNVTEYKIHPVGVFWLGRADDDQ